MQKYIKKFISISFTILIAPVFLTGFVLATVFGSLLLGWRSATTVFDTLAEWVSND